MVILSKYTQVFMMQRPPCSPEGCEELKSHYSALSQLHLKPKKNETTNSWSFSASFFSFLWFAWPFHSWLNITRKLHTGSGMRIQLMKDPWPAAFPHWMHSLLSIHFILPYSLETLPWSPQVLNTMCFHFKTQNKSQFILSMELLGSNFLP